MVDNEFIENVMKETGLEIKETDLGRAMFYNGLPLVWTPNKSDEYLQGFAMGFARSKAVLSAKVIRNVSPALKKCPFCGCDMKNDKDHFIYGNHKKDCYFHFIDHQNEYDFTNESDLLALHEAWNNRV